MIRKKSKIAVVGIGWFGRMHLDIWSQINTVEVVGLCDINPSALNITSGLKEQDAFHKSVDDIYSNNYLLSKVRRFVDLDDMLCKVKPDILDIVVPEADHFKVALSGIKAGCDIIVEKPFVLTSNDAKQLINKAQKNKSKIYVGHILRFDPRYRSLASLLFKHDPINLRHISLERNFQTRGHKVYGRTHPAFASCIHDIDILLWLSRQAIVSVSGYSKSFLSKEHPDVVVAIIELESGAIAVIQNVWHIAPGCPFGFDFQSKIFIEDNTYCIRNEPVIHHWGKDQTFYPEIFFWPKINSYRGGALFNELSHFEECSRYNRNSELVPLKEVMEGIKVAESLIQATTTGTTIKLQ